jgi:hypothetical protein
MPNYYVRVSSGQFSGGSDLPTVLPGLDAAWEEIIRISADLLPSISREIKPDGEWQMELLDESKQPVFRIRLLAETIK